jgi:ribosomal protein S18 acetylase RimI-like enzyme
VRTRALRDAPYAFESRLENDERRPDADWAEWADRAARGEQTTIVLALDDDGHAAGMAGGFLEPDDRDAAIVFGVWVEPRERRGGLAARLVAAVEAWAAARGLARLTLWVTETNEPALRLYERLGYRDLGERQPFPPDPSTTEVRLGKELTRGSRPPRG